MKHALFCFILRHFGLEEYIRFRNLYQWITGGGNKCDKQVQDVFEKYGIDEKEDEKYLVITESFPEQGLIAIARRFLFSYSLAIRCGMTPILDVEYGCDLMEGKYGENDFWGRFFVQKADIRQAFLKPHIVVDMFDLDERLAFDINGVYSSASIKLISGGKGKLYYKTLNALAKTCWQFKPEIKSMFAHECRELFGEKKRVLGVMLREDFSLEARNTQTCEENISLLQKHPVNISIEETIKLIEEMYYKWACDAIFVSTMYQDTIDRLEKIFGNRILYFYRSRANEYNNYDIYDISLDARKQECNEDENTTYYLRDIYALSKCSFLVGHVCGGTQAALVLNGGKYHDTYILENQNKNTFKVYG